MLKSALFYHDEGLCVIPCVERDKMPALEWDQYKTKCSTTRELNQWFGNGHHYNIGIVHGEVSNNYVAIDIDHDNGIFSEIQNFYPQLFKGRIEQSGSGEGFHIPLRLGNLPDFGINSQNGDPIGNRTWKTGKGHVNIRARFCQTVAPPSVHPSGNRYKFLQKGPLAQLPDLNSFINWLDTLAPPKYQKSKVTSRPIQPGHGDTLLEAVKCAWSPLAVFDEFGMANDERQEKNGEVRLLGHGGLLVDQDKGHWYCFADEFGGGVIEAWGWCRFGSSYDNRRHLRQVLVEMAQVAGIDLGSYHQPGDEEKMRPAEKVDRNRWGKQFDGYWERMR